MVASSVFIIILNPFSKRLSVFPPWKLHANILQNQIGDDDENSIFTINNYVEEAQLCESLRSFLIFA